MSTTEAVIEAATKEHPILFSGEMVRAILDGRKTQTRRIVKAPKRWNADLSRARADLLYGVTPGLHVPCDYIGEESWERLRNPWSWPSYRTRLWVRETFSPICDFDPEDMGCLYKADYRFDARNVRWKPSIHMPRRASRLTLEVTGVRVERVQDITEKAARDEATFRYSHDEIAGHCWYPVMGQTECGSGIADNARDCFRIAWNHINGPGSWAANPWVWVVEFQKIENQ